LDNKKINEQRKGSGVKVSSCQKQGGLGVDTPALGDIPIL